MAAKSKRQVYIKNIDMDYSSQDNKRASLNKRRRKSKFKSRLFTAIIAVAIIRWRLPLFKNLSSQSSLSNIFNIAREDVSVTVNDPKNLLNDEIKDIIMDYGLRYGKTLKSLSPEDIGNLYYDKDCRQALINNTAFKTLAGIRKMSSLDLKLEYVSLQYNVKSAVSEGDKLTITILEDNVQKFKHLKKESLTKNSIHYFVMIKDGGKWKLESHTQEEDYYLLVLQAWDKSPYDMTDKEKAENVLKVLLDDAEENYEINYTYQNNNNIPTGKYSYNRSRAIKYAEKYWDQRNWTDGYNAYDDYGGNCQNFCSQSIKAGGMKMDYTGSPGAQWKWYGDYLNEEPTASGRSSSWTGVDAFYNYATSPYSQELVCAAGVSLKLAEKGDVLQLGAYGEWRHSVLVIDVIKNLDGSVKDIIIASNTADRWNYPASAYVYTAQRLIHILGQ